MKLFIVIAGMLLLIIIGINLGRGSSSTQVGMTSLPTSIVTTPTTSPVTYAPTSQPVVAASGEPMVCYPAPQEGILRPLYCGTPNMTNPYWCNLAPYPATTNPSPAVCGYKNEPDSIRQCLFTANINYAPGSIIGYMACR